MKIKFYFFLSISVSYFDCRVIESFVKENSDQLSASCLDNVIELCVNEMVKASEHTPLIQDPCLEILVAVGRFHCTKSDGRIATAIGSKSSWTFYGVALCWELINC